MPSAWQTELHVTRIDEVASDQFGENRGHDELEVPLLSIEVGLDGHPLDCELEPDRQLAELVDLGDGQPDGHGPVAPVLVLPVREDVAGVADAPAVLEKIGCEWLEVHLRHGLAKAGAAERPPVLEQ